MKLQMISIPLELRRGQREFSMNLSHLATVRAVTWSKKEELVLTAGQPQYRSVPVLHIEVDPDDQNEVPRTFMLLAIGDTLEPRDGVSVRYVASGAGAAIDGSPLIAHLFEIEREAVH